MEKTPGYFHEAPVSHVVVVMDVVVVVVVVYGKLLVFTSKHFCHKCVSAQFSGC